MNNIIPTPKHVDLVPNFTELAGLVQHAYEVSTQVNPQYRSILAHMAAMICMQMGHELRGQGYATLIGELADSILADGQYLVDSGNKVKMKVLAQ